MRNEKILKRLLFYYLKNKNIYGLYKHNRINYYEKTYDPHRTCFNIRRAFSWSRTKEGFDFWDGIATNFERKMGHQQERYHLLKIYESDSMSLRSYLARYKY